MNKELHHHLITKYRESIAERYDYDKLKSDPKLPKGFTKETINELKDFFLENLYSAPKQREKLDAAFKQLETYVAHPTKVWGLLGNLASAIFQFGMHFPAAIKVGMVSLKTHTSARHFEDMLLQNAIDKGYKVPLTDEQFRECLAAIPMKQLQSFIDDLTDLFRAITDGVMLEKTIHILQDVLVRMKSKKDLYGPEDIDAIQLGVTILQKGYDLLSSYDDEMKERIVEYIAYNETRFIKNLQKEQKKKKA